MMIIDLEEGSIQWEEFELWRHADDFGKLFP
jgi:hypothetical protein